METQTNIYEPPQQNQLSQRNFQNQGTLFGSSTFPSKTSFQNVVQSKFNPKPLRPPRWVWIEVQSANKEECTKAWQRKKRLGQGNFGFVDQVCKEGSANCEYAMKVSLINTETLMDVWEREVFYLNRLQATGIVPRLEKVWVCGNYGFYVMEKYDGTIEDLILLDGKPYKGKIDLLHEIGGRKGFDINIINQLKNLLGQLDKREVIHGDLKMEQILYKKLENEEYKIVVIDFGAAFDFFNYFPPHYEDLEIGWIWKFCQYPKNFMRFLNAYMLEVNIGSIFGGDIYSFTNTKSSKVFTLANPADFKKNLEQFEKDMTEIDNIEETLSCNFD